MNCTLASEAVIFRTGLDTQAAQRLFDHPIAFEIDHVDEFLQTGWSVLVVGKAQPLRSVIASAGRGAIATAVAGGQTSAGGATAADDDDGPSSPPVLTPWRNSPDDQPDHSQRAGFR
jgi:hypothetical protein